MSIFKKIFTKAATTMTVSVYVWLPNAQRFVVNVEVPYPSVGGDTLLNAALEAADKHRLVNGQLLKDGTSPSRFRNTPLKGATILTNPTLSKYYAFERW